MTQSLQQKKDAIRRRVVQCIRAAEEHYEMKFPLHRVLFDLRGVVAGQAQYRRNRYDGSLTCSVRFNSHFVENNFDDMLLETAAHEVAHVIVRHLQRSPRYTMQYDGKPHGKLWKHVMRKVLDTEPSRTHNYDVSHARPFIYTCGCVGKQFNLSKIIHNKMLRGQRRYCKTCNDDLSFSHITEGK